MKKYHESKIADDAEKWRIYFKEYLKAFKTKNVLVLWGDDFAH